MLYPMIKLRVIVEMSMHYGIMVEDRWFNPEAIDIIQPCTRYEKEIESKYKLNVENTCELTLRDDPTRTKIWVKHTVADVLHIRWQAKSIASS